MQRRVVGWVKDLVSCPDPYPVLAALYRKVNAVAYLDIGSHQGYTVLKLLDFTPGAKVHAFEPTPQSAAILRSAVAHHPNVTVHELAISDKTGRTTFFLNAGTMQNSLLDNDETPFADVQAHVSQIDVQTVALDEWAARHEPVGTLLVKADVQGAEAMLVAGGRQTFAQRVAAFYTEVCLVPQYKGQADFWDLHRTMTQELGFVLYEIYPCGKDATGRAAFTDVMWVKPDVLPLPAL
jgi:FkbM family methyltransferase